MAKKQRPTAKTVHLPDTERRKVKEYDPEDLIGMADDAQRKQLAESGRAPYIKLKQGETSLHFPKQRPAVGMNGFGKEQVVFRVVDDKDAEWDLPFALASPMVKKLGVRLAKGAFDVEIVRAGEGRETTYALVD